MMVKGEREDEDCVNNLQKKAHKRIHKEVIDVESDNEQKAKCG
jgi:hypothetical protein